MFRVCASRRLRSMSSCDGKYPWGADTRSFCPRRQKDPKTPFRNYVSKDFLGAFRTVAVVEVFTARDGTNSKGPEMWNRLCFLVRSSAALDSKT